MRERKKKVIKIDKRGRERDKKSGAKWKELQENGEHDEEKFQKRVSASIITTPRGFLTKLSVASWEMTRDRKMPACC